MEHIRALALRAVCQTARWWVLVPVV